MAWIRRLDPNKEIRRRDLPMLCRPRAKDIRRARDERFSTGRVGDPLLVAVLVGAGSAEEPVISWLMLMLAAAAARIDTPPETCFELGLSESPRALAGT